MGHERIGHLPKSKKWRDVVDFLAEFQGGRDEVKQLAAQTLVNVRSKIEKIDQDAGFSDTFKFLVAVAGSFASFDAGSIEKNLKIKIPDNPTPLALAIELKRWLPPNRLSEIGLIAQEAAIDSVTSYYVQHKQPEIDLFGERPGATVWQELGTNKGFCELARLFFANYTNRYLNYFLEREAASSLKSLSKRIELKEQISNHAEEVSHHAFETAKITQSFAAGWYAKRLKAGVFPSNKDIKGFLRIASGKLLEEIRREGQK